MASGTTKAFAQVSGTSATNLFAVDESGGIWHYDGASWASQPAASRVSAVWAGSATRAFAAGSGGAGAFLQYDGQRWGAVDPPPVPPGLELYDFQISAIWGTSATDVWAVGQRFYLYDPDNNDYGVEGHVAHFDGTSWSSSRCCGDFLEDVWGSASNDIVYVTDRTGQKLWHFNGAKWSIVNAPFPWVGPIWGSAANDVYMLADGIWHFNGVSWTRVYTSATGLSDIWGSSATDVYVVGEGGTILHGAP